jgi:GDP-4-dehydro-6-deoxy-D-mannose reductase
VGRSIDVGGPQVRVLITGITGFVGSHLADALIKNPALSLFGVVRNPDKLMPGLRGQLTYYVGDLESESFVRHVLEEVQPQAIYHLAGQAFVPMAWSHPWQTFQTNILPQLNLFTGLIELDLRPRFLSVGSAKVYGQHVGSELPINEDAPLQPDSPYGVSKAAQDLMAQQYFLSHQMPVIRVRPFNHIGPRQAAHFVTATFAQQIALAEAGLSEPIIRVGNLSAQRDFTDVRDVVRAYRLLIEKGPPGEAYNIASGKATTVQEVLNRLLSLSTTEIQVIHDQARLRPIDQPVSYGAIDKIERDVGWQPEISLDDSLKDILAYWRQQVATKKM